jgi:hypothetical protein
MCLCGPYVGAAGLDLGRAIITSRLSTHQHLEFASQRFPGCVLIVHVSVSQADAKVMTVIADSG